MQRWRGWEVQRGGGGGGGSFGELGGRDGRVRNGGRKLFFCRELEIFKSRGNDGVLEERCPLMMLFLLEEEEEEMEMVVGSWSRFHITLTARGAPPPITEFRALFSSSSVRQTPNHQPRCQVLVQTTSKINNTPFKPPPHPTKLVGTVFTALSTSSLHIRSQNTLLLPRLSFLHLNKHSLSIVPGP